MPYLRTVALVALALATTAGFARAQSTAYHGPMLASIAGTIASASGSSVTPTCSASVQYTPSTSAASVVIAVVGTGTCSSSDASYNFSFNTTYTAATQALAGTYTDPAGATNNITFTKTGATSWQSTISGTAPSSTGGRSFSATITLQLPTDAYNAGLDLSDLKKSGSVSFNATLSIPVVITALGVSTQQTDTVAVSGTWSIYFVPNGSGGGDLTGSASRPFTPLQPVTFTAPAGCPPHR